MSNNEELHLEITLGELEVLLSLAKEGLDFVTYWDQAEEDLAVELVEDLSEQLLELRSNF